MLKIYLLLERFVPSWLKRLIPERLRILAGYELKVRRPQQALDHVQALLRHDLILPAGQTLDSLHRYLSGCRFAGEDFNREMKSYLADAYRRFLYTLQLIPEGDGRLLEIGASPYFMSLLLQRFTSYTLSYINYLGPTFKREDKQRVFTVDGPVEFNFYNVNVEEETIPYPQGHFDVVLMGEVLEHFTNDPLFALLNIARVLKPGGYLILTTPNVNRLVNIARMFTGLNIYDPYSGYGPHGRHNREYTLPELKELLAHAGFQLERAFSSDVHENKTRLYYDPVKMLNLVALPPERLGQYLFVRAHKTRAPNEKKPSWLYRSYPSTQLSERTVRRQ